MLRSAKDLNDYKISATDGEVGHVKDLYFDDDAWAIRYFVVDTGTWLSSRKVLISPISVHHPDWPGQTLPVSITKAQVKNSPAFDADKPVGAICHGPWTLIEAGGVRGRRVTSWPSLKTDLKNAGADWEDKSVMVDGPLVTSRKPDDLEDFCREMVRLFGGASSRQAA